jgi:hypothetical protein
MPSGPSPPGCLRCVEAALHVTILQASSRLDVPFLVSVEPARGSGKPAGGSFPRSDPILTRTRSHSTDRPNRLGYRLIFKAMASALRLLVCSRGILRLFWRKQRLSSALRDTHWRLARSAVEFNDEKEHVALWRPTSELGRVRRCRFGPNGRRRLIVPRVAAI